MDPKELLRRNFFFIRSHAVETNSILAILFQKEIITLEKLNEMKSPYKYQTDESKIEEIVNILIRKDTPFELLIDIFKQSSNILIFEKLNQFWENETNNNILNQDSSSKSNSSSRYYENKSVNLILPEYTELDVQYGPIIGHGAFGIVQQGEIRKTRQKVAIKRHIRAFSELKKEFENELNIMGRLKHTHIMELFGVLKYDKGSSLIFEYLENGDLLQFVKEQNVPNNEMLIRFSFEISCGMEYLHYIGIIHRDLNASNVLLDTKFRIKIGDFGLSRYLEMDADKDYYIVKSETKLRLRWIPKECLFIDYKNGKFSKYSDIWSYGATLWEIWNKGLIPFANLPNNEITKALLDGMSPISYYDINSGAIDSSIYELMKKIFNQDPFHRPLFLYIKCHLFDLKNGQDSKNILTNFSQVINISGEMQKSLKIPEKPQKPLTNTCKYEKISLGSQIDTGTSVQNNLNNSAQKVQKNFKKENEFDYTNSQNSNYTTVKLAEKNEDKMSQNTNINNQNSSSEFKVNYSKKTFLQKNNTDILNNAVEIYEIKIWKFFQKKENITFESFSTVHELSRKEALQDLESNFPKDLKHMEKSEFKKEFSQQIESLKVNFTELVAEITENQAKKIIYDTKNESGDDESDSEVEEINKYENNVSEYQKNKLIDESEFRAARVYKEAIDIYEKNVSEYLKNVSGTNSTYMEFKIVDELWESRAFGHFDSKLPKKLSQYFSSFRISLERKINELRSKYMLLLPKPMVIPRRKKWVKPEKYEQNMDKEIKELYPSNHPPKENFLQINKILKNSVESYEKKLLEFFQKEENITFDSFSSVRKILTNELIQYLEANLPKDLESIEKSKIKSKLMHQIDSLEVKFAKQVAGIIEKQSKTSNDESKFKACEEVNFEKEIIELTSNESVQIMVNKSEQIEQNVENKLPNLKKLAIGIHFGTEFIRCGIYSDSEVQFELIESSKGQFVFRNFVLVYQKEGKSRFLTGEKARNEYMNNTKKYTVEFYGNKSRVVIDKRLPKLEKIEYIVGFLLWDILLAVKAKIHDGKIHDCVIALPIFSSYSFRIVVKNAGKIVGFKKVHIVTEPMAAAYTDIYTNFHVHPRHYLVLTSGNDQFDSTTLRIQHDNGIIYSTCRLLLSSYPAIFNSTFGNGLSNKEENFLTIKNLLSNLRKMKDDKIYVIFAGDQLSAKLNYLETIKNRLKYDSPQINLLEYNFTEGIVKGASILAAYFLNGIYNPENFIEVNIENSIGRSFVYNLGEKIVGREKEMDEDTLKEIRKKFKEFV